MPGIVHDRTRRGGFEPWLLLGWEQTDLRMSAKDENIFKLFHRECKAEQMAIHSKSALQSGKLSCCIHRKEIYSTPIMKIISGSAHPDLAQSVADYLQVTPCDATVTAFPDGETFVKINENVRGSDVYIIQPTCPPTNSNLMELLITVDAAKRASAARITAVIPFFGLCPAGS